jgi:cytochrome c oxidase assembly protein subunit 15
MVSAEWASALLAGIAVAAAVVGGLVVWAGTRSDRFRAVVLFATALTFCLVVVGAYVRLSDAGLGCPDWPGCYGHPQVAAALPGDPAVLTAAQAAKGWKEMAHRYLASMVGLLILTIAIIAVRARRALAQSPALAIAVVAAVILQAALGRWSVTLLLKPAIVSLHLAVGMTTLALLVWLSLRQLNASRRPLPPIAPWWRPAAAVALVLVGAQMLLGGWVSSNYAALACPDLPLCRGAWLPPMDISNAFHIVRDLGRTSDGGWLSLDALTAIHWVHRVGAALVVIYCSIFAAVLLRQGASAPLGLALLVAVWGQAAVGIANVLLGLPLPLAATHNAGAAALLTVVVVINFLLATAARATTASRVVPRTAGLGSPGEARGS